MTDEVFEMAAQKLIKYTETKEYKLNLLTVQDRLQNF